MLSFAKIMNEAEYDPNKEELELVYSEEEGWHLATKSKKSVGKPKEKTPKKLLS